MSDSRGVSLVFTLLLISLASVSYGQDIEIIVHANGDAYVSEIDSASEPRLADSEESKVLLLAEQGNASAQYAYSWILFNERSSSHNDLLPARLKETYPNIDPAELEAAEEIYEKLVSRCKYQSNLYDDPRIINFFKGKEVAFAGTNNLSMRFYAAIEIYMDCVNLYTSYKEPFDEALKWLQLSAEQGYLPAQSALAERYFYGHGVPQNYSRALKWSLLAGEKGDLLSQSRLGSIFLYGEAGVSVDYVKAFKWYRLAARQGSPIAQLNLGNMYHDGNGVEKNNIAAFVWLSQSIQWSDLEQPKLIFDITNKLSQEELALAKDLAYACFQSEFQECP